MRITGCLAAALLAVSFAAAADSKADRQVLEKKFIDTLTECQMEGSFTIDGSKRPPASDKYTIAGVRKIGGDDWLIEARIQYMKHDVTLPVPVKVLWAGDTPVISLTDVTLPGLGTFSTRLLIHGDRYAGSWQHDKVGGAMWGKITKAKPAEKKETEKKETEKK